MEGGFLVRLLIWAKKSPLIVFRGAFGLRACFHIMKILVTGGAGFIGSHVSDAFLQDGHEVAILDSFATGSARNLNPDARFFEADMRDKNRVDAIFAEFKPDAVSHHAAQISVPDSVEDPAFDAQSNIVGGLNVWRAARDNGARRFIFASSGGAIYGDAHPLPVDEKRAAAPLSPYGLSKQVFEMYLLQGRAQSDMVPVVLRYANVYGPRQGAKGEAGVVSVFTRRLLNGQQCTIFGDGSMTRDYVFVGDVTRANQIALERGDEGVFNIATGTQTTTLELFETVRELLGCQSSEPVFAPERAGEVRLSCLDASKARRELNWQPQVALREGLAQVVAHDRNHQPD